MTPLKIVVMLGGPSAEREVSLRSGAAVASALRALGHSVHELDPVDDSWVLPDQTDVVFLALHGTYGEDGTVQRRLDALRVRYTGCGPDASETAFDKVLTKQQCITAGVPTARYFVLDAPTSIWPAGWRPPVVLKPVCQGSSVGLHVVRERAKLAAAITDCLRHDRRVLMEEWIEGREATVGILEGKALPIIEVRPKTGILDYRNKYTHGATEYLLPARFDATISDRITTAALGAFRAVHGRDYARVDIMVTPAGAPVVLEVNTLPGMTELSLLPKAAAAAGFSFPALCQKMVDLALAHPLPTPKVHKQRAYRPPNRDRFRRPSPDARRPAAEPGRSRPARFLRTGSNPARSGPARPPFPPRRASRPRPASPPPPSHPPATPG